MIEKLTQEDTANVIHWLDKFAETPGNSDEALGIIRRVRLHLLAVHRRIGEPIGDGGAAFPAAYTSHAPGMTLRDYFAAKALQGLLAGEDHEDESGFEFIAEYAYNMADAMLAERDK